MKVALVAALAAALAVGCSAETEPAMVANDALENARADVDPDYLVFANQAEGEAWLSPMLPAFSGGGPLPAIVPPTDARTVRVAGLLAKLWPTIRSRFGARIPTPMPLVVESPMSNAFVSYDPQTRKAPNAVVVFSKILDMSDAHLEAVLAHELGHLVLKHPIPGARDVVKYYQADSREEPMGIHAKDDPAIRATLAPFIMAAGQAGAFVVPELGDVPLAGMTGAFVAVSAQKGAPTNPDCQQLMSTVGSIRMTLGRATGFDSLVDPTAQQKGEFTSLADAYRPLARSCISAPADVDFVAASGPLLMPSSDPQVLRDFLTGPLAVDASVFAGKDALTGAYAITATLRARVAAAMAAPNFERLRQYTGEEEADDFSMTVLHEAGLDPTAMGESMLFTKPPAFQEACRVQLANGEVPRYHVAEQHHTFCYRKFHSTAFSAWLARGGAGVQVSAPIDFSRRELFPGEDPIIMD